MSPRLNFVHLCDYAFTGEDGKLSMIGIFNTIKPTKSIISSNFFIVLNLTVETNKTYKQSIKLINTTDDKEVVVSEIISNNISADTGEVNFIGGFHDVKIDASGDYVFQIIVKDMNNNTVVFNEFNLLVK